MPRRSLTGESPARIRAAFGLLEPSTGTYGARAGTRQLRWKPAKDWQESTTGPEPGRLTCPTATTCYVEGDNSFYVSGDGAQTWIVMPIPDGVGFTSALSCTSVTDYAAGSDLIAQRIGNTYNAGSAVVAVTRNAGRTWQRVTFAVPAHVPGGMQGDSFMDIGQIECPQADACVTIGVSDQGSTSTPLYTNHG